MATDMNQVIERCVHTGQLADQGLEAVSQRVSPAELTRNCILVCRAPERVDLTAPRTDNLLHTDAQMLSIVLGNLLDNACKYGAPNSRIQVSLTTAQENGRSGWRWRVANLAGPVGLPEVDRLWGVPQPEQHHPEIDTGVHLMMVLDTSARLGSPLSVRYAALCHDLGKGSTPAQALPRHIGHEERSAELLQGVAERLRVPVDCRETAEVVAREHGHIHRSGELNAAAVMRLLTRCDAIRQSERFALVLQACEADARGRLGLEDHDYPQAARLAQALKAALGVVTADIAAVAAREGLQGPQIGERIDDLEAAAVDAIGVAGPQLGLAAAAVAH